MAKINDLELLECLPHRYFGGRLPVAPIGEEKLKLCTNSKIREFFLCKQRQYISARRLAAPIYSAGYCLLI
jgi:hypothetical protein